MKKYPVLLCALLLSIRLFAQTDSVALVHATWSVKKINAKVYWKTTHLTNHSLFGANENISIIVIPAHTKSVRLIVGYSDSLETTSQQAKRYHALAGINGSFFKMRGADPDSHPELNHVPKLEPSKLAYNRSGTYLRKDGILITPNKIAAKQTARRRPQLGVLALSDSGATILKPDTLNFEWENTISARDIMTSGPLLIIDNKNMPIGTDDFSRKRHPRTAVGKLADGTTMLLVVDGRFEESAGMNLIELQQTMRWLGCVTALNLDGGGSSAMYIKGEPDHGIVNYPSDNKKYDHAGEREVANTVLVVP
ncbi:phosphodiester glycosidase family protein [Mucilaginibacter boryungensis]|uniref:Phosphodiester glycosidase family protein n=1 Tax=Mucilaginibacter boryungensis TaxID=768480 RepID=A0ABR9XNE4_9SPHI|nr:phosphodiester glycosidase family protein [Mucilaginibacter boryungensis]MBE9668767.1 phosphodiester glycosidase family protein [Mucilaginibacter boryungensis]